MSASLDALKVSIFARFLHVLPFLKPEGNTKYNCGDFNAITINDFVPEKIKEFEEFHTEVTKKMSKLSQIRSSNDNIQRTYPHLSVDSLKKDKKVLFDEWIEKVATDTVKNQLVKFHRGVPLTQIDFEDKPPKVFMVDPTDFEGIEGSFRNNERLDKVRAHLHSTLGHRTFNKKIQERLTCLDHLSLLHSQKVQMQWFYFVSKELNKKIQDLTPEDLTPFLYKVEELAAQSFKKKQDKSELTFQQFMGQKMEAQPIRSRKKRKKGKKAPQKNPPEVEKKPSSLPKQEAKVKSVTPVMEMMRQISEPGFEYEYTLDKRIPRWKGTVDDVREFIDRGTRPYKNKTLEQRAELKASHNLSGLEALFNFPELLKDYSFSFPFIDNKNEKCEGTAMYAVRVWNKKKTPGFICAAWDKKKKIYHLMFHVQMDKILVPSRLAWVLDRPHEEDEEEDTSTYTLTKEIIFSANEKGIIQAEIGKNPEERVTYRIRPLI